MRRSKTYLLLMIAAAVLATGCAPVRHNLPPEQRLLEPGPGVGGPGPGVLDAPAIGVGAMGPGGLMGPGGVPCGPDGLPLAGGGGPYGAYGAPPTVQVTFGSPELMQVRYGLSSPSAFDSEPLIVPARQNFPQGGLYRLKLTNIVGREGVELYPTLEIAPATPRTGAYLAHNSIPIQFTEEDFDQVLTGNFVTKVLYLPDPEFQGPALAGIDTLVSTRLDPGVDPIVEADRRGSILAIVRLGDKDIEMAGPFGAMGEAGAIYGAMGGYGMEGGPGGFCGPGGVCPPGGPYGMGGMPPSLPGMISGVTMPQYGMPHVGTPIGLPGPPHVPLGAPAGLTKHVMRNHTPLHLPQPVDNVKIDVRHAPGMSYPQPASRVHISEQNIHPGVPYQRPHYDKLSQPVK